MYKLFLTLRYLLRRRIALFAITSVWLCVAMVLIVISVMGGFLDMVKERSRGLLSDLIVDNQTLQGFPYYQEFIDELRNRLPDALAHATPAIYNYGIMRVKDYNYTKPVQVVGIRLDEYMKVNDFPNALYYNRYYPGTTTLGDQRQPVCGFDERDRPALPPEFEAGFGRYRAGGPDPDTLAKLVPGHGSPHGAGRFRQVMGPPAYEGDELPGIILGTDLINERTKEGAYERVFSRGCDIVLTLLPMTRQGAMSAAGATTVAMRYADDSYTRVYEIDKLCAYVDFDRLQRYLGMDPQETVEGGVTPARTSQILVKLAAGVDARDAKTRVEAAWRSFYQKLGPQLSMDDDRLMGFVRVETWEERQREYISAVEKEKVLVLILFGVISLVAVVLVGCIFYMIVSQKTRDIGVMKSVGASSTGVASIFIGYAAAIGVVGSVLGTITGVIFVRYVNELQDALARFNPNLRVWSPDVYAFDRIPNVVKPTEAVWIFVVAVIASMIGALIPAILAGRVWPVKALRYE